MKMLIERTDLFNDPPLSSVSPKSMVSIIPFLPVGGYIGTPQDREAFITFARAIKYRPAYMVKIVHRSSDPYKYRKTYQIIAGADTFQQAKDKCIFDYRKIHGFTPNVVFIACLPTRLD